MFSRNPIVTNALQARNVGTDDLQVLLATADTDIDDGDIEEAKQILRETRSRAFRSGYTREWMDVAKRVGMNSVARNAEHPLVQECYDKWSAIVWDCINFLQKQAARPKREILDCANELFSETNNQYGNKKVLSLESAIAKAIDVLKREASH